MLHTPISADAKCLDLKSCWSQAGLGKAFLESACKVCCCSASNIKVCFSTAGKRVMGAGLRVLQECLGDGPGECSGLVAARTDLCLSE